MTKAWHGEVFAYLAALRRRELAIGHKPATLVDAVGSVGRVSGIMQHSALRQGTGDCRDGHRGAAQINLEVVPLCGQCTLQRLPFLPCRLADCPAEQPPQVS